MKLNWNFQGEGGEVLEKSLLCGRYEYFLELHNAILGTPIEVLNSSKEKPVD